MSTLTPRLDRLEKNYIINGNMDFWQRETSFAALTTAGFSADRFQANFSNTATRTISRSTSVPNTKSTYSLQYIVGTADAALGPTDYENIHYHVEGYDFRNLSGKDITLSFYVKSSVTGTYTCAFRNSAVNRSYVTTYIINTANTWEKKVIHLTHDASGVWLYDNNTGINISFALMAGLNFQTPSLNTWQSNNYVSHSSAVNFMGTAGAQFNITQIAVYEGTLTDPEFNTAGRNIADELMLCQRYFEKSYNLDTFQPTATAVGRISSGSTTGSTSNAHIDFCVRKRATPVITLYNSGTVLTAGYQSERGFMTAGGGSGAEFHYYADAELL